MGRICSAAVFLLLMIGLPAVHAQDNAPCGVVDAIDYPIDGIVADYDDFGLYRARFGGNHTGLDVAFGRWGDPVQAAARGRVTYSDVEGWGTERGVIVIEHTFPDGSIYYTVYGHVEQSDSVFFPQVGQCVERGEVLAGVGYPSRGAPHLHYEVRDFLPDDGGPGYVTGDPLAEGWYHPLDFTYLWRARLSPAYVSHVNLSKVPTLPPVTLDSGMVVIASGDVLVGIAPPDTIQWRVQTDGVITGLAALPGDRVAAHTRNGQVVILQGGRYAALWTIHGPEEPFVLTGDQLVFVTGDGGLAAYDTAGSLQWTVPGDGSDRVVYFEAAGDSVALGIRGENVVTWRLVDSTGQVMDTAQFGDSPVMSPAADGGWLALDGSALIHMAGGQHTTLAEISPSAGRTARMVTGADGSVYIYLGDADNTLLSLDSAGAVRWQVPYPHAASALLPPLLYTDGCLLYTLDVDGMLNVFDGSSGALVNQMQFYAGGIQSSSPPARLLEHDKAGNLRVGSGFLTVITLDSQVLGGETAAICPTVG